jgi:hypothetical protein
MGLAPVGARLLIWGRYRVLEFVVTFLPFPFSEPQQSLTQSYRCFSPLLSQNALFHLFRPSSSTPLSNPPTPLPSSSKSLLPFLNNPPPFPRCTTPQKTSSKPSSSALITPRLETSSLSAENARPFPRRPTGLPPSPQTPTSPPPSSPPLRLPTPPQPLRRRRSSCPPLSLENASSGPIRQSFELDRPISRRSSLEGGARVPRSIWEVGGKRSSSI